MKDKIAAVILLIILITAVTANTIFLTNKIDDITDRINQIDISKSNSQAKIQAESIYQEYKRTEKAISLTVSHDDLTNIEDSFTQMISYLSLGNTEEAFVMKSRLVSSLEHLRRLSGFNIDSLV